MNNQMINNLLFSSTIIRNFNDDTTGEHVEITQFNVSKYFKHLYIIVKRKNQPIPFEFYNSSIPKDIYDNVVSNLMIYKTSIKLLKNVKHFNDFFFMSNEQLSEFNIFGYNLDTINIVVPIFNIEFQNLLKYLEQYETTNTLQNTYKVQVLNNYFNFTKLQNNYLESLVSNLEESNYWTLPYNCLYNLNKKFKERKFFYSTNRIIDRNIADIIKNKLEKIKIKESNYMKDIELDSKESSDKFNFTINQPNEFTHDDIYNLLKSLHDKEQFLLFANLIVSKRYCHMVLNNKKVLELMNPIIVKFALLFRYLISYAWIRFYIEEQQKLKFITTEDQFIFDIDTAALLPVYPFNHKCPRENPYMPLLMSDRELAPEKNFCGVGNYNHTKEINYYGLANLSEFRTRMNLFTTRNQNNDIFSNIDFKKLNAVVTGSIMAACLQKENPLTNLFNGNNYNERFVNFLDEYYSKSDIDIMFMVKNDFDFFDKVTELYNMIVVNICAFNDTDVNTNYIKLEMNNLGYVFITEEFINMMEFDESLKIKNKVEYVESHINDESLKEMLKPHYIQFIEKYYDNYLSDFQPDEVMKIKQKYKEMFEYPKEIKIYINRKPKMDLEQNSGITFELTYKYKITAPYLNHPFEIFANKQDDPFALISKFHVPCVRSYYNGMNVYMTPSCISSHMTFMNIDYRYVTGTKDPMTILNNYRMKTGMGTYLNSVERNTINIYSKEVEFWKNLYDDEIFGYQTINSKLFKPRQYNSGYFEDSYVDITNRYKHHIIPPTLSTSNYDISKDIINKFGCINITEINYSNFKSINNQGTIIPLKKWIINATWENYEANYQESSDSSYSIVNGFNIKMPSSFKNTNDIVDSKVLNSNGWKDS